VHVVLVTRVATVDRVLEALGILVEMRYVRARPV
jgi:hypothetical protein